ncbi:SGNH/GDSL hydrolase family protein [Pelagibacterium limicola]|uniref:SGNH/GDSL hydrolase family protein n=1 Tax=Pelagibacterium limicola TaxID=2791022 RepID=UPI0018B01347|nr:SGNH/GDSL hydrolase family protein [Pelagibacterium limicola]
MGNLGLGLALAEGDIALRQPGSGARVSVVAWGDSLTRGAGVSGDAFRYPVRLSAMLGGRTVVNRGIGGQTSTQIAARQGGVPILVTLDGDAIPASTLWTFNWSQNTDGWYSRSGGASPALVTVDEGDLLIAGQAASSQMGAQVRLTPLSETLPVGTQIVVTFGLETTADTPMQVGLTSAGNASTAGSWVAGSPIGVTGSGHKSVTLSGSGGSTLALFIGTSTHTFRISNLVAAATLPVAVSEKSVNVLFNSGVFTGSSLGTIAGVHGRMTTDSSGHWTFTRDDFGSAVTCPPGTPFIPDEATSLRTHTALIWAGRNNSGNPAAVKADIAAMIAHLGHGRYLVGAILNGGTEITGTSAHAAITALNAELAALYGARFVDLRAALIAAGDPTADAADIANDVMPASLRSDHIHLNDAGYGVVAEAIRRRLAG